MYFANNMGKWYDTGETKCNQSTISDLALPGVLLQMLQFGSNKTATAAAKSLQSCPTLLDPIDGSPPGTPVPGILQARTLEWVAISFFKAWKWKVKVKSLSRVRFSATPWTAAYQAPPSMGFSRQEYWSGVPLPSPSNHFMRELILPILQVKNWGSGRTWTGIHLKSHASMFSTQFITPKMPYNHKISSLLPLSFYLRD